MSNRTSSKWRAIAEEAQKRIEQLEADLDVQAQASYDEMMKLTLGVRKRAFEDVKDRMELYAYGEPPVRSEIILEVLNRLLREESIDSEGNIALFGTFMAEEPTVSLPPLEDIDGVTGAFLDRPGRRPLEEFEDSPPPPSLDTFLRDHLEVIVVGDSDPSPVSRDELRKIPFRNT